MTLPHAADPGGRNRQAALLQCLRHPHLAPGRLSWKGRELGMEPRHWSRRRSAAPARPVEPPQPGTESSLDSLLERAGFELSVPGDGELCWGALTLGCIRGDRSAGAGTVQCDFFCSAGFENAQATRFFPAQYERVSRAIRAARRNGAEQRESRLAL